MVKETIKKEILKGAWLLLIGGAVLVTESFALPIFTAIAMALIGLGTAGITMGLYLLSTLANNHKITKLDLALSFFDSYLKKTLILMVGALSVATWIIVSEVPIKIIKALVTKNPAPLEQAGVSLLDILKNPNAQQYVSALILTLFLVVLVASLWKKMPESKMLFEQFKTAVGDNQDTILFLIDKGKYSLYYSRRERGIVGLSNEEFKKFSIPAKEEYEKLEEEFFDILNA